MANILLLCDDVLANIFNHLNACVVMSTCRRVCTKFRDVSFIARPTCLKMCCQPARLLQQTAFSADACLVGVTRLHILVLPIRAETMLRMLAGMPNLAHMYLQKCRLMPKALLVLALDRRWNRPEQVMEALDAPNTPGVGVVWGHSLRTLNVSGSHTRVRSDLSDSINAIIPRLRQLTHLDISSTMGCKYDALKLALVKRVVMPYLCRYTTQNLASQTSRPPIRTDGDDRGVELRSLTAMGIPCLYAVFPFSHIQELSLYGCSAARDKDISHLILCEVLNISRCRNITPKVGDYVAQLFALTSLNVSHTSFNDTSMRLVGRMCTRLCRLDVSCDESTELGLRVTYAGLELMTSLTYLRAGHTDAFTNGPVCITDAHVARLLKSNPGLMLNDAHVPDKGMLSLASVLHTRQVSERVTIYGSRELRVPVDTTTCTTRRGHIFRLELIAFGGTHLNHLHRIATLQSVKLTEVVLTVDMIKTIGAMPLLRQVELTSCDAPDKVDDPASAAFTHLITPTCRDVNLKGTDVHSEHLLCLADACRYARPPSNTANVAGSVMPASDNPLRLTLSLAFVFAPDAIYAFADIENVVLRLGYYCPCLSSAAIQTAERGDWTTFLSLTPGE